MRGHVMRGALLGAMGVVAVAGWVAQPQVARADYPGGTYVCDTAENRARGVVAGFGCVASEGAPTRGPVDKFWIQESNGRGALYFCSTGIATIGITQAPNDLIANGCQTRSSRG